MSISHPFNNTFVLPVISFGENFGACLYDFRVASKHVSLTIGNLMEQADYQADDINFVAGAGRFLKKQADKNVEEVIDFAQEELVRIERGSYYALMLSDMLLRLSERVFSYQEIADSKAEQDGFELSDYPEYHEEAIGIVQDTLQYTEMVSDLDQGYTYNRAVDLLLRYGRDTPDPFQSVVSTSIAMNSIIDADRGAVVAHLLCNRCFLTANLSPEFTLQYLGGAIDALDQEDKNMEQAIGVWQNCMKELDVEDALSIADYNYNDTDNPAFLERIEEVIATLKAAKNSNAVKTNALQLVAK